MTATVPDLLGRTEGLCAIGSESRAEGPITDHLDEVLSAAPWLERTRIGDNLVARTTLGRPLRLVLAGHTDTVPANGNAEPRRDGSTLWGLGTADMKGGLAVMVELALAVPEPAVDVTYVFYAREEIAAAESGLEELFQARPDLLEGDAAILGEPTDGELEAGCQGTLRMEVMLAGARAHSARPWMGRNAIHRLGPLLSFLSGHEPRQPVLGGLQFREALQAVQVSGGVAANVVPDAATLVLNHRFAPDRTPEEAEAAVRALLEPFLEDGDTVELTDASPGGAPDLDHPLLRTLVDRHGLGVRAKLGWTDVARFASRGVPAANLG
ncbi:MAG TPA: succinyl-diaminopimelate desuccinylase, partial [Acidimicrobiales bacterium]|nr:succinyl-diaminopimelate desuccinylase [Acidimicrobiales bacterium]